MSYDAIFNAAKGSGSSDSSKRAKVSERSGSVTTDRRDFPKAPKVRSYEIRTADGGRFEVSRPKKPPKNNPIRRKAALGPARRSPDRHYRTAKNHATRPRLPLDLMISRDRQVKLLDCAPMMCFDVVNSPQPLTRSIKQVYEPVVSTIELRECKIVYWI